MTERVGCVLSGIFRCPYIFEIPRTPVPLGVLVSVICSIVACGGHKMIDYQAGRNPPDVAPD